MSFDIFSAFAGIAIVGSPLVVALVMQRTAYQNRIQTCNERITALQADLVSVKEASVREVEVARNELSIEAYPFEEVNGSDGFLVDDRLAEVGYKFQLFIKGVPCFEPHKVVTKRMQKKDVNPEKLKYLKSEVANLLESIASKHPAFNVAGKMIK